MTTAIEDYVKVIYAHTEWQPDPITPSQLAARLGLAASSVTEMVKKLAALGLVTHQRYGAITLTEAGRQRALAMVRRHRLVETWLVRELGYGWHEVHDEAEVLEHAISDRLLDAIDEKLGRPSVDPHGDPIPAADGTLAPPRAMPLADAGSGTRGVVCRVSDRDPALLRHLEARGIVVGAELEVEGRVPFGGAFTVRVHAASDDRGSASQPVDLGEDAVGAIWVSGPSGADAAR
ncbi:metal-dependent transcriptional regulator [Ruicaihuangia caeni]|uniref:Manganese transport regulator n=1 Tax=Ruicaihuangia caeni TaxID=3042517 RepID=A0AAW6T217_9MICO|nr:metal-dependent transcriptional regulator [Klugiella sp. YN-L-19]MDI2097374.1 metal-dependent transcriptional regulator [Klugiella sp. YN-L-19]